MHWFLILFLGYRAGAVVVTYDDQAACETAGKAILEKMQGKAADPSVYVCTPSQTPR